MSATGPVHNPLGNSGAGPRRFGAQQPATTSIPRRHVFAWALWDWGGAAFNAVITTFVFTVYLTGSEFVNPRLVAERALESNPQGPAHIAVQAAESVLSSSLGWALAVAGFVVALLAPIMGQRSDSSGRRKLWLGINTGVVVAMTALMFFVVGAPTYFLFGIILVAVGTVFYELATVNYNAMLTQVSTPATVGRVSGFGWGAGYLGGILLLLIVYFGLVVVNSDGTAGFLHASTVAGLNIRIIALISALWTLIFSLPVLIAVPEVEVTNPMPRVGFFASYSVLVRDIIALWKQSKNVVLFLIASALFRDGLVGVFTFGGILAQGTFGFSSGDVIIFAIVANVVAGLSTLLSGTLDDRVGAKPIIVVSLIGLIVAGLAVFFLHTGGAHVFWIGGLILCLFVGPAQSASRTFLARIAPPSHQGQVFGLYATTGRAVSFIAPSLFALFIACGGAQYWGILGIVLVLIVGLLLLIPVRSVRA